MDAEDADGPTGAPVTEGMATEGADGEPARVAATVDSLRGVDGSPVWSVSYGDLLPHTGVLLQRVGDLTADGTADVLVSIQLHDEPSDDGRCDRDGCAYTETFTWDVQLLEGRDGSTVWRNTYPGSMRYVEEYDPPGYSFESSSVNGFIPLQPLGDVTGDGRGDVLATLTTEESSHREQVEGSYPGPVTETSTSEGTASTELRILDGADGTTVDALVQPEGDSVLSARPVDDRTGDDVQDLLVTERQLSSHERVCTIRRRQHRRPDHRRARGSRARLPHAHDRGVRPHRGGAGRAPAERGVRGLPTARDRPRRRRQVRRDPHDAG